VLKSEVRSPKSEVEKEHGGSSLEDVERQHIEAVLRQTNWMIEGDRGAAKLLNLNPSTLRSRMQKLDIRRPGR
jgi:transcriptional regulator with GAF, ATPase, and Fis domain